MKYKKNFLLSMFFVGCVPVHGEWEIEKINSRFMDCYNYGSANASGYLAVPVYNANLGIAILDSLTLNIEEEFGTISSSGIIDDTITLQTQESDLIVKSIDPYSRREFTFTMEANELLAIGQKCFIKKLECSIIHIDKIRCSKADVYVNGYETTWVNSMRFVRK